MGLRSWWRRRRSRQPEASPVPAAPTEQDILAALNRVNTMLRDGNAPPVVTSRVVRIARTINATLPRLRREWADTRPIDGYKTSLMVLIDQLELLGSTMEKILDAANRADAQALVIHGRFLEEKFGHGPGTDMTLGPPA